MEPTQSKTELSYLTRSLLHHPSPYIIYELDGSIAWANMAARYIFDLKELAELSIDKIDDEINPFQNDRIATTNFEKKS